jgi:hypothetical protein
MTIPGFSPVAATPAPTPAFPPRSIKGSPSTTMVSDTNQHSSHKSGEGHGSIQDLRNKRRTHSDPTKTIAGTLDNSNSSPSHSRTPGGNNPELSMVSMVPTQGDPVGRDLFVAIPEEGSPNITSTTYRGREVKKEKNCNYTAIVNLVIAIFTAIAAIATGVFLMKPLNYTLGPILAFLAPIFGWNAFKATELTPEESLKNQQTQKLKISLLEESQKALAQKLQKLEQEKELHDSVSSSKFLEINQNHSQEKATASELCLAIEGAVKKHHIEIELTKPDQTRLADTSKPEVRLELARRYFQKFEGDYSKYRVIVEVASKPANQNPKEEALENKESCTTKN